MSKLSKKLNRISRELFIFVAIFFILVLTFVNLEGYMGTKKVLGVSVIEVETSQQNNEKFWNDFLQKNPKYIPGWVELGRMDKVEEIDPNYF